MTLTARVAARRSFLSPRHTPILTQKSLLTRRLVSLSVPRVPTLDVSLPPCPRRCCLCHLLFPFSSAMPLVLLHQSVPSSSSPSLALLPVASCSVAIETCVSSEALHRWRPSDPSHHPPILQLDPPVSLPHPVIPLPSRCSHPLPAATPSPSPLSSADGINITD